MPGNTEPEPPTVTAIREALQQYEADRQEAERQLEVLSREALYEVPDKDEPPTQAVVDLWEAGFAWSIAEELIKLNHGDIKQYERDGVMPSPTRPSSDDWLASNRKKEDRGWWDTTGPTMLRDYLVWRQTSGWRTAAFNGVPAIELDISGELTEALKVKAYLDRVELHPDFTEPTPCVVDLKTSAKEPGEPDQLEWYAVMLERLGYPKPQWGAYYDARRGRIGRLHPMVKDYDYFAWKLGKAKSDRDNNGLVANTQSQWCRSCGVRPYCYAVGGSLADQVPRPWHEAAERRRISLSISPV